MICRNCKDWVGANKIIPLCPICRRTYGWGAFVGGIICGALVKLLS